MTFCCLFFVSENANSSLTSGGEGRGEGGGEKEVTGVKWASHLN